MHAIEELVEPPYLYGPEREYTLTDDSGKVHQKTYTTHGFAGYVQRYDRVEGLLDAKHLRTGMVGKALCYLIDAEALRHCALQKMREDPFALVDVERN